MEIREESKITTQVGLTTPIQQLIQKGSVIQKLTELRSQLSPALNLDSKLSLEEV